jgi:anti-anti-sigma factor
MNVSHFKIEEGQEDGQRRLALTGQLDMAAVPVLEARLDELRDARAAVRLDLSKLEFIDSSGLHLLVRWIGDARRDGWNLEIDRDVAPAVRRLFELVGLERLLEPGDVY